MLKVIEEQSEHDTRTGNVVVESDYSDSIRAHAELRSIEARDLALKQASQWGMINPGINGIKELYPVDKNGEQVVDTTKSKINSFRAEIAIISKYI